MRYAQRGGYTPAEQDRREQLRLETTERFARKEPVAVIARDLRVTERTVRRRRWQQGGAQALRSAGRWPTSSSPISTVWCGS
ncbi:helix-turn-helix domain-containing protein [Planomonospora sphaerica]|uniref:helix-turn-helix domain-containing protein n=1 Tax=Planomonospora sphaerica TaxID=161355 RepID=UPI00350E33C8